MSKLLKGKCVFLDTQVFRKALFGVCNPAFKKLSEICKDGDVRLVTTKITRQEIDAQIEEAGPDIKKTLGKAASILAGLGLPEPAIQGTSAATITEAEIVVFLKDLVATFFRDCEVQDIEFPKGALHNVLDLYFGKRPPFGAGKKKAEFPDAFVLEALKSKAGRNGESIYVVSEDTDLVAACNGVAHLESVPSVAHFLNLWNVHSNSIKQVRSTLSVNTKVIHETLDRIVEGISGDIDAPGSVEISHRNIVDILDELVISCDETKASVEFVCLVEFDAWLEIHPPHNGPFEYRNAQPSQTIYITLEFRFDPANPKVFEVDNYWAPQSITISAHSAW
jgi:hypothetical protein